MRRVYCDQYEFAPSDSEQGLELAIAEVSRHVANLDALLDACGASSHDGAPAALHWLHWPMIAAHLRKFANVEIPHPSQLMATIIRDDWDDVEVGLAFDNLLIWYHWSTTA